MIPILIRRWLTVLMAMFAVATFAAPRDEYILGPSDVVKISVYENPEMLTETRIGENGKIHFPLLGEIAIGGLSIAEAENKIGDALRTGKFVPKPHVTLFVTAFRSQQVSVLGYVNRPGLYPIEKPTRLSEMLANAGGINPSGADVLTLTRVEAGQLKKIDINQNKAFGSGDVALDIPVRGGDVIFVPRAPQYYIYGEVQHPGYLRLEQDMTVTQALAGGGGVTARGSETRIRISRRDRTSGKTQTYDAPLDAPVLADDVIFVPATQFYIYGEIQRPGPYRIEPHMNLTQAIAVGGGPTGRGSETSVRISRRDKDGKMRLFEAGPNELILPDDAVYMNLFQYYIYGEVQRPGSYRIEANMNAMQALANGGGVTPRGTERGMKVSRRDKDGNLKTIDLAPTELILPEDVIYVKERLF